MYNHTTWLKTSHWMCPCSAHSYHPHANHDERLIVSRCFSVPRCVPSVCLSITLLFSSHFYLFSAQHFISNVNNAKANIPCVSANWGVLLSGRIHSHRLWAQRPWRLPLLETSEIIFQEESGDKDTVPSFLCDAELDDQTIGKAPSSPLFIQEREEPANRRQAYHSHEESLLPAQSFVAHTRTGSPVHELRSCQKRKSSREMENEANQDSSWKTKKSKSSLTLEPRFRNTNFKPILIEEVFRNWMELLSLSEEKLIILLQLMNNFDEINYFFMNSNQNKIGIFVKLI